MDAHAAWLRPWTERGCAPALLHGDADAKLLVIRYLPAELVLGTEHADDPHVYRQAGELLALLHAQDVVTDDDYERRENEKSLAWLGRPHRIAAHTVRRLRAEITGWPTPSASVVPTHGDWQPRNWLVHDGVVSVIDFGRAAMRPAFTDLNRLADLQGRWHRDAIIRAMRKIATTMAAVLLASGCTGGSVGTSTSVPSDGTPEAVVTDAPTPGWRLAALPELAGPTSVLWDVVSVDATHAWAVGSEAYSPAEPNDTGTPLILQWDGTNWARAALPAISWRGRLDLVAADSARNVWAVGSTAAATPEDQVTHVLHYDGSAWREVPFARGDGENHALITGLTVLGGHAWLVGNDRNDVIIEQWDGRSWRSHQPPAECRTGGTSFGGMPNFCTLTAIKAFGPDDVWAAGNGAWKGFTGPLLFHWNGTGWRTVQVGINEDESSFEALAGPSSSELWAVGDGGLAVRGSGGSFELHRYTQGGALPDVVTDLAGQPWLIDNSPAPSASLVTYGSGTWAGVPAPQPSDATGMSLHGLASIPDSPLMFAVGAADLPTTPRYLTAVVLEYAPAPSTESRH
nr:aminoglycoside phosphotransferase family protein [Micromonospora phaseoli]